MAPARLHQSILGTFDVPVHGDEQDDPYQRAYLKGPTINRVVKKSYPLIDVREQVFPSRNGENDDSAMMRSARFMSENGFTWVKHESACLGGQHSRVDLEENMTFLHGVYYAEIEDLVKRVTGCKHVFITNSAIRGPKQSTVPIEKLNELTHGNASSAASDVRKPMHNSYVPGPTRIAHNDYTPLGARLAIRHWTQDMNRTAHEAGIISAEDKICQEHSVDVTKDESDGVLAAEYNVNGTGPRYAALSIWRPLKKITRDPLAITRFDEVVHGVKNDSTTVWQYDIRAPGWEGDWCRRLEMLRVDPTAVEEQDGWSDEVGSFNWYYLSEQEPNEVLFLRLFDSASLGDKAVEAKGSLHGSPDLGELAYGGDRENIEVRLVAIW